MSVLETELTSKICERPYGGTARLDPRCKLLILILVGLTSYFVNGSLLSALLIGFFSLFVGAGGQAGWAVKVVIFYAIVSVLSTLLKYIPIPVVSVIMSVFGVTVLKMVPIVLIGRWILKTTPMDDLMVSFQRMRMPLSVAIPLVVMFRYIPTLGIEYRMIRDTMKIRGICDTVWKKILHPMAAAEYILIPLLMRCLKVTDELAASGTTRGLERNNKRYSLGEVRYAAREWTATTVTVFFLAGLIALDYLRV